MILILVTSARTSAARTYPRPLPSTCGSSNHRASSTKKTIMVSLCALTHASSSRKGFQANASIARKCRFSKSVLPFTPALWSFEPGRCPLIDQMSCVEPRCNDNANTRKSISIESRCRNPNSKAIHCNVQVMITHVGPYADGCFIQ